MRYQLILSLTCLVSLPLFGTAAEREPWTTSRLKGSPDPPKPFSVERVYPSLQFNQPVELMAVPGTNKMMILEVTGKLFAFENDVSCESAELVVDFNPLMDKFRRAYGFALHPEFATNRQLFVAYAGDPVARPDGTRLSRFIVSREEPLRIDTASEEVLMTWPSGGHNGCAIRFDSKGLLYFSTGDGARPFPPDEYNVGQNLSDLRSSICRIDVDQPSNDHMYSIPADNPFVDVPNARGEIFAYGFRNPWRFTIVPGTDQILCGDVGWELWELIFDVKRGGNYGWSIFEGPQPIRRDVQQGPTPIELPLVAYPHALGQSVTGGHVYRGKDLPELKDVYLYGDYVTGLLWGMRHEGDQVTWNPVLAETGLPIITFAEMPDHETLVVGYDGGIYQLVRNQAAKFVSEFPRQLSSTGLFADTQEMVPEAGVVPYQISAPSWQGGGSSEFLLGVPGQETIQIARLQRGWKYPAGTVFAKTISLGRVRVETQVLHFDGINWQPYSYLWNDDQTDADLVEAVGVEKQVEYELGDGQSATTLWKVQNRAQCRSCHGRQNGGAVGFSLENLSDTQVGDFLETGVLDRQAPPQWKVASMVSPHDLSQSLDSRARSYLAANCAHCHRRGGGGTVPADLSYSTDRGQMNVVETEPSQGSFGMANAKVVAAGRPLKSTLFYRMATSGSGHMPKLGHWDNDRAGLQLVYQWIASLESSGSESVSTENAGSDDTSVALKHFVELIFDDKMTQRQLQVAGETAQASGTPSTAALFERFLPIQNRRKRLGNNVNRTLLLEMVGDAERGRERFLDGQSMQCSLCHRVQGSGRSVGPDMDGIGKRRSRQELLDSVLDPSKVIDPKYRSHQVLSTAGQLVSGLLVRDTETEMVIRSADGRNHRISKDEIESQRVQVESLMPSGLAADLTAQEVADLLAFLVSLK
ncbi:MAG: PQQ-dependent sugar dehydrogenase [Rubripirellula sp.]